jgi:uncharacterized protein DUF6049
VRPAGRKRHRQLTRAAALAGAAALIGTALLSAPSAVAQPALTANTVRVSVVKVTPSSPVPSTTPRPVTVVLKLTNATNLNLPKLTVQGDRGNPISTQTALDQAIGKPQPPDPTQVGTFSTAKPVTTSLRPHGTVTLPYASTTDTIPNDAGLCICQNRIYPLYFTVHTTDSTGTDVVVGAGQTYIPAFGESLPKPVQVSWVWPIIDRPHRLDSNATFSDDALAASVETGRLDRVLKVVEEVGPKVPMTLIIDPELIDELAVMSNGPYRVEQGDSTVPGVGTAAAAAWLSRLRTALAASPHTEVDFTPLADPDVESLTRNGLDWTVLNQESQARTLAEFGGSSARSDIAWPAGEVLSPGTLNNMVRKGATKVILNEGVLPGGARRSPSLNALAPLQTPAGPVTAAVTSSHIQRYVSRVISTGRAGNADLPKLVAEVAIRAVEDPSTSHYVVIVPPRNVDPSPVAARAILATARTFWSRPLTLGAATPPTVQPADHGPLVGPGRAAAGLPPVTINTAQDLAQMIPAFTSMLSGLDANAILGQLPTALQRAESSDWVTDPALGVTYAQRLSARMETLASGVHIFKPSGGTYTLASSNSPLPVTIVNSLDVSVFVHLQVASANGVPGFSASDLGRQQIAPGTKLTLHVPTHVDRTGRFVVQATLYTPSGAQLGAPVFLSVHSTALGTIGVIITIVAAVVLLLALLVRLYRSRRNPRPKPGTAPPATTL